VKVNQESRGPGKNDTEQTKAKNLARDTPEEIGSENTHKKLPLTT